MVKTLLLPRTFGKPMYQNGKSVNAAKETARMPIRFTLIEYHEEIKK
jgi:hypothetical protein